MYCQTCGSALTQPTKYCNRCGTQLVSTSEQILDKVAAEKRLDEYLDGLFWISVFGLAFILGGMALLRKVNFSDLIVIGYVILSTTVFLINFGFSIWGALRIMRSSKEGKVLMQPAADTRELPPAKGEPVMVPASVTENTTRSFEPIYKQRSE